MAAFISYCAILVSILSLALGFYNRRDNNKNLIFERKKALQNAIATIRSEFQSIENEMLVSRLYFSKFLEDQELMKLLNDFLGQIEAATQSAYFSSRQVEDAVRKEMDYLSLLELENTFLKLESMKSKLSVLRTSLAEKNKLLESQLNKKKP